MSPSVASSGPKGKADRVQGITSSVDDITLRASGKRLELELGVSLTSPPRLTRTINGASSLELEAHDPNRRLLRHALVSEKWDVEIDGLHFRYPGGLSKSGDSLTLTLEDRWAAILRESEGPKRVVRGTGPKQMTRAEFIKMLVEEAAPKLEFICPQLHRKQPIKTKAQGKKAADDAKVNRGKGVGDIQGLTVKGTAATAAQRAIGDRALRTAESYSAPNAVLLATMEALIVESGLGAFSSNYMQIEPESVSGFNGNPNNIEEAVVGFLKGYEPKAPSALGYYREHPDAKPHEIAQAVQRSEAGLASDGAANYGPWQGEAQEWVEAFGGEGAGGSVDVTEPFEFIVKKKETYWAAIKRMAKEVNWRAFIVGRKFFYMPEPELIQGMVRLAIDDDTPGIEDIDFEFDGNSPITEVTVSAFMSQWKPPPGSVATLADYGPASIGFGDAPVKKDKKGQKTGISGNRNAATGEGRARYLVASMEVPLSDDPAQRLGTVTLHKPTAPLPEPAPKTHSVGGAGGTLSGDSGEMGVLSGTAEDVVNTVIDYAHANGFPNVTRESVRAANATHGPTSTGGRSDHQGPPETAWAADISNGETTPEETHLAAAIAKAFGIPWNGSGLITHETGGYRLQLIYKAPEHYDHVHFGCEVM